MDPKSLISRGHLIGGGLISPDRRWFVMTVPKNASSYTTNLLLKNSWEHWNLCQGVFECVIFPVRDPVDRWISGLSTYCCSYLLGDNYGSTHFVQDYNNLVEKIIVENTIFDDHTAPQTLFESFIPDQYMKKYVWVDRHSFVNNIQTLTGIEIKNHDDVYDNSKDTNPDNLNISKMLRSRLTQDIVDRIKLKYLSDYKLIETTAIYGKK